MKFKGDIIKRIGIDFGERASEATELLKGVLFKVGQFNTDRIIRCIVHLAKGNIIELNKYIRAATIDPRDVMFWAEYEGLNQNQSPKRIRDFNKTFEECLNDVKE